MIITKSNLIDHVDKLKEVLTKLQSAGLKINADKSTFCSFETEYLGVISCPISEIVKALANGAGNEGQVRRS